MIGHDTSRVSLVHTHEFNAADYEECFDIYENLDEELNNEGLHTSCGPGQIWRSDLEGLSQDGRAIIGFYRLTETGQHIILATVYAPNSGLLEVPTPSATDRIRRRILLKEGFYKALQKHITQIQSDNPGIQVILSGDFNAVYSYSNILVHPSLLNTDTPSLRECERDSLARLVLGTNTKIIPLRFSNGVKYTFETWGDRYRQNGYSVDYVLANPPLLDYETNDSPHHRLSELYGRKELSQIRTCEGDAWATSGDGYLISSRNGDHNIITIDGSFAPADASAAIDTTYGEALHLLRAPTRSGRFFSLGTDGLYAL